MLRGGRYEIFYTTAVKVLLTEERSLLEVIGNLTKHEVTGKGSYSKYNVGNAKVARQMTFMSVLHTDRELRENLDAIFIVNGPDIGTDPFLISIRKLEKEMSEKEMDSYLYGDEDVDMGGGEEENEENILIN